MASPVSRHSPRWMAAVMASTRRRVILRFVPPPSSHSWASSGVMVTISRFRSGPRVGGGGCLPLASALARVRDVRGQVGLRVVDTKVPSLYQALRDLSLATMLREVIRDEMAWSPLLLSYLPLLPPNAWIAL